MPGKEQAFRYIQTKKNKNISKWERNEKKEVEKTKKKMYDFRRKLEQKYLLWTIALDESLPTFFSSTINSIVFWFRGKSLKYDEVLCRIELLFLCIVFLVSWMHPPLARTFIHYFRKNLGPYVGLPEETRSWNTLLKPWKSISRKSYSQELLSTVSPLSPRNIANWSRSAKQILRNRMYPRNFKFRNVGNPGCQ